MPLAFLQYLNEGPRAEVDESDTSGAGAEEEVLVLDVAVSHPRGVAVLHRQHRLHNKLIFRDDGWKCKWLVKKKLHQKLTLPV